MRCQDIELNKRLRRAGGKIYLIPSVRCKYIPRDNYTDFARNRYLTGYWVLKSSFICGTFRNLGYRHFVPLLFVISLITSFIITFACHSLFVLPLMITLVYLGVIVLRSLVIKDSETRVWSLVYAFIVLHISYGWGSLCAALDKVLHIRK